MEWKKNLSLYLTLSRIFVVPFFFIFFHGGEARWFFSGWAVSILFILASITDWFDGNLARRFKTTSSTGALLDSIADKILVLSALIILLELRRIPSELVAIFIIRDILIGGIRSMAAASGFIISARNFGKWKAGFQMVAIPCLFIYRPLFSLPLPEIGYYMLWLSAVLSLISAFEYIKSYFSHLKKGTH